MTTDYTDIHRSGKCDNENCECEVCECDPCECEEHVSPV